MIDTIQGEITADEFFEMSFPHERTELVRGEVTRMSPGGADHGVVAMNIGILLGAHVKRQRLGVVCAAETGFLMARDPDTVRAPDVGFVSHERMGGMPRPRKYWPFAPDLAVEVVSPGDTAEEIETTVGEWFAGGARRVWVFYPVPYKAHDYASPTEVRILQEEDTLDGGDVVPGFACRVSEVFE
jgi:Uma2 family endonuclease